MIATPPLPTRGASPSGMSWHLVVVALAAALLGGCFAAQSVRSTAPASASTERSAPGASLTADFDAAVKPLIKESCAACHNPKKLKGDLDLEQFLAKTSSEALKHR